MIHLLAACANVAIPEPSAEALRYYNSGNLLWTIDLIWSFVLPALFLFTGFSAKLENFSQKLGRNWFFTIVVYLLLFIALTSLLSFPLDVYSGFIRPHDYGLSSQAFGKWLAHYGTGIGITIISAAAFVWLFYLILKKSPKKWWLYGAILASAITFFATVVTPIWIEPLFNDFGPMKNKELEQKILALAGRAGISDSRIFEVDKSQETHMVNAYVTGFGPTKRIVLWDTIIQKLSTNELLFVMGHEMGHYVLHHIWWLLLNASLLFFLFFYLLYKISHLMMKKWKHRFGFSSLQHIASFPLFLLIFSALSFAASPLMNYFSRAIEHNADIFGLEITRDNEAAAKAFVVLQSSNLANPTPGPLYTFFRETHPSLGKRIQFCNTYCPWEEGKPLKYGKYFDIEKKECSP